LHTEISYNDKGEIEEKVYNYIYQSNIEPTSNLYLDRLWQWDSKKYDRIATKHFGKPSQILFGESIESIKSFLGEYLEKNIELCEIEYGTRPFDGFYWFRIGIKEAA